MLTTKVGYIYFIDGTEYFLKDNERWRLNGEFIIVYDQETEAYLRYILREQVKEIVYVSY